MSEHNHSTIHPLPRFIVGMSRAATTWMCKCLNEHPHAAAFGESVYWGRRYVQPESDGRYTAEQLEEIRLRLRAGDFIANVTRPGPGSFKSITQETIPSLVDEIFRGLPDRPTPGEVFTALCDAIAEAEGKDCAIEKTPHHINWADRILKALPEASFVVMLRDPYGFMLSYKHFGDSRPEWMRRKFRRRYHPFGCTLVWRGYIETAMAVRAVHPDQTHFVWFEDVKSDPNGVLDGVQEFLGLPNVDLLAQVPPDNTSFPGHPRPSLRGEDVFWMNLLARRSIRRTGLEFQRVPLEPIRIIWSILRLPIWAVRNIFSMRKVLSGSVFSYLLRWVRPPRPESAGTTM